MEKRCDECNTKSKYNERYDAYYCDPCNKWISKDCKSPDCFFCVNRPKKPKEKPNDKNTR